jgi:hypothetical protein
MGPLTGAEALSGTYAARLHVDGRTFEQTFMLADDPGSPWTSEQRAARHAFLVTLFGWFDGIDKALNEIDARLKRKTLPDGERARLIALRNDLTSNPLHDEDSISLPDRIREQIGALIGQLGGALQPPFEQHQAALDALRPGVAQSYERIAAVLGAAFAQRLGMRPFSPPAHAIIVAPTLAPTPVPAATRAPSS